MGEAVFEPGWLKRQIERAHAEVEKRDAAAREWMMKQEYARHEVALEQIRRWSSLDAFRAALPPQKAEP